MSRRDSWPTGHDEPQPVAERSDGAEEGVGIGGQVACEANLAVAVDDDEEQSPGVEISTGIESGVGGRIGLFVAASALSAVIILWRSRGSSGGGAG
jgi:hypothetical protein